jgi:hypothetical protein
MAMDAGIRYDRLMTSAAKAFAAGKRCVALGGSDTSPREWDAATMAPNLLIVGSAVQSADLDELRIHLHYEPPEELLDPLNPDESFRPLEQLAGASKLWRHERPTLFAYEEWIGGSMPIDWTVTVTVYLLTDTVAVVALGGDWTGDAEIIPRPIALVNPKDLHRSLAWGLRFSGGIFEYTDLPTELACTVSAVTLFRILLVASRVAGDEVWRMSNGELAKLSYGGDGHITLANIRKLLKVPNAQRNFVKRLKPLGVRAPRAAQ